MFVYVDKALNRSRTANSKASQARFSLYLTKPKASALRGPNQIDTAADVKQGDTEYLLTDASYSS